MVLCIPVSKEGAEEHLLSQSPAGDSVQREGLPDTGESSPDPSTFRHTGSQVRGQAHRGQVAACHSGGPDA